MPRFVLLEHTSSGVHWDFMLERGDGLATWAIDAPVCHGIELPARRLPTHRVAYLDYEGPISGNRGTVQRVDCGDYEVVEWSERRAVVQLFGQELRGRMELWAVESTPSDSPWRARFRNRD